MSPFDKDLVENEKPIQQRLKEEELISDCLFGATVVECNDPRAFVSKLEEVIRPNYHVLGKGVEAERLKKHQGRPVIRWNAKTFKKDDADGSMYQLSKLPKEPKPIVIIENIADIPDGDRNIYDDPAHIENVLLHSWKDDAIHLTYNGIPFQMNKWDYSVVFPVRRGDLQNLRHSISSDGFAYLLAEIEF